MGTPVSSLKFKLENCVILSSLFKVKYCGEFCWDIESISTILSAVWNKIKSSTQFFCFLGGFLGMLKVIDPIQDEGATFSPVTSANVGISPQNFLCFSLTSFATLVKHLKFIPSPSSKLLDLSQGWKKFVGDVIEINYAVITFIPKYLGFLKS